MAERWILHCDCNSFFASVELLRHPDLVDKPVAVSDSVDERHGIILAKNEAAKKFAIQTAQTVWQAKRNCPGLILLPPHRKEYTKYSKIINEIYAHYTDLVEPFGIDESWLDITQSWRLFASTPWDVADQIRSRVKKETGLTISVGVSFNKIFAKLGSDYKKPDATTLITKENYKEIVWPLGVGNLLFAGRKSTEILKEMGIKTIGELAQGDPLLLQQVLGKQGTMLQQYAAGENTEPVLRGEDQQPIKSVGNGMTFRRNLQGYKDVRTGVGALAEEVAARLRRKNVYATSVQITIKDESLKSITRQKPLPYPTNLTKDVTNAAMELVQKNWDLAKPIRMLTVTAQQLTGLPFAAQTSFLEQAKGIDTKRQKLEQSLDKIREKYGGGAIGQANILHNTLGITQIAEPEEEEELV